MSRTVRAAVVREKSGPWSIETLELDDPRADEILVRVVATGVCHTDLSIRDQFLPLPFPIVLGHEGAGVVEQVGPEVKGLAPGDHVVLAPMSCGACCNCQTGLPMYCDRFLELNVGTRRPDGSATLHSGASSVSGVFFGQSSFATYALANARSAIKVPNDLPLDLLGPLGCGVQTGAGTVLQALRPPAGSSIAIFGTGAVGLSAVMAARVAGCGKIIAVDVRAARLELARELGATDVIDNSSNQATRVIHEVTGGRGVRNAIDTTALPGVIRQAVDSLSTPGCCAVVGLAPVGAEVSLEINSIGFGRTIRGVTEGESVPSVTIPMLIDLWRQGRFPFDRLVRRYEFDQINQAAADMASGVAIKPVLVMPAV